MRSYSCMAVWLLSWVSQCTRVFSSYPDGNGETMSELMEEPEGFENESEDEELMSPDHEDDDEEPASE